MQQISGLPSGSIFQSGTTTNVFEFVDDAGNRMTCSFDVVIVESSENIDPGFIGCPLDQDLDPIVRIENGDLSGSFTVNRDGSWQAFELTKTITQLGTVEVDISRPEVFRDKPLDARLYRGIGTNSPPVAIWWKFEYTDGPMDFGEENFMTLEPGIYTLEIEAPQTDIPNFNWPKDDHSSVSAPLIRPLKKS